MQKLVASDADNGDRFGQAVAIDDDVVVSGAFRSDDMGLNSGSAYVYRFDGTIWNEEVELHASDGAGGDRFGWSVDVCGNRALVGALEDDDDGSNSGSAYVFHFDGTSWSEEAKLTALDGQADDEFGFWVAIDDDVAVIGAHGEDAGGAGAGAAYVFRRVGSTWSQEGKLCALDASPADNFGVNVDVFGDLVAVGADLKSSTGAAYVFRHAAGTWAQEAKFTPPPPNANDRFGYSVSLDEDALLVGSMNDDAPASSSGSAYVYRFDGGWSLEQQLVASDGNVADFYGWSVCLDSDVAVVGARLEDEAGSDSGAAYVYRYDPSTQVWAQEGKFVGSDTASGDSFAFGIGAQGDRIVAGAWSDDDAGSDTGSAYVFTGARFRDCNSNGVADACDLFAGTSLDGNSNQVPDECECAPLFTYCTAKINSEGCLPSISFTGIAGLSESDPFDIRGQMVINNRPGLLFYGHAPANLPFQGGTLCVQPPLRRTPIQSSGGNLGAPDCSGEFSFDFNAWTQAGNDATLVAGTTVNGQFWYRDPPTGSGTGLSNGIQFEVCP